MTKGLSSGLDAALRKWIGELQKPEGKSKMEHRQFATFSAREKKLLTLAARKFECSPSTFLAAWIALISKHDLLELLAPADDISAVTIDLSKDTGERENSAEKGHTALYFGVPPRLRQQVVNSVERGRTRRVSGIDDSYNTHPRRKV